MIPEDGGSCFHRSQSVPYGGHLFSRVLPCVIAVLFLLFVPLAMAGTDARDPLLRGRFVEAIEQSQQDLPTLSDPAERAERLLIQGEAYWALGRWIEAERAFDQAWREAAGSNSSRQQGRVLCALARIHPHEPPSANSSLSRARDLLAPAGPSPEWAEVQILLGEQAARTGDPVSAAAFLGQAHRTAEQITDPLVASGTLLAEARFQSSAKHPAEAGQRLSAAEERLRNAPPSHQAALNYLAVGRVYLALTGEAGAGQDRRVRAAHDSFQAGLRLAQELQDDYATALANAELGALYADQGRTEEALQFYRRALFASQTLVVPIQYRWEWQSARLLARLGRHDQATHGYRRAIEQLQELQPPPAGTTADTARFRESTGTLFFEFADLLLRRAERADGEENRSVLLRQVQEVVEQLKTAELKDYFKDDCLRDLKSQESAMAGALTEDTTAVLYPLLLPDRTVVLVSRGHHIVQRTSPLPTTQVVENARQLRELVEKRATYKYLGYSRRLYDALIRPIEADLQGVDTLVFVPDGALRLVPLATLNDGSHYLLERFAVATSPGLRITDFGTHVRQDRQGDRALISALTEARQGFPALPNVAVETTFLTKLFPSTLLKDQSFGLDNLRRSLSDNTFDIIHLASHGHFEGNGRESFILTYDEHLSLDQLERFMRLTRFKNEPVKLLTMSACQTAAGDDRATLGLGGVAVKAGARSALATLWLVNDEATTSLMEQFYHQLADSRKTKAEALRQAQMALMKTGGGFLHAGLWGPFLLIGNWH
ncbi:putative CHAT domain-containing protein [Gammaproteobacteria bacterium]